VLDRNLDDVARRINQCGEMMAEAGDVQQRLRGLRTIVNINRAECEEFALMMGA
jgi:hypothetical protein